MPSKIEALIAAMEWAARQGLQEYSAEIDGTRTTLRRAVSGQAVTAMPAPRTDTADEPVAATVAGGHAITAPLSGICHLSGEEGGAPFVRPGEAVRTGQTLCLVEAMKVMTAITADREGELAEICVEDGAAVGAGDVLMRLGR